MHVGTMTTTMTRRLHKYRITANDRIIALIFTNFKINFDKQINANALIWVNGLLTSPLSMINLP
jgi:hypothetical protein